MPTCIRCRRESEEPAEGLVLRLDGPDMLRALRELPREKLSEEQRLVADRLAAGLCPACGRELD